MRPCSFPTDCAVFRSGGGTAGSTGGKGAEAFGDTGFQPGLVVFHHKQIIAFSIIAQCQTAPAPPASAAAPSGKWRADRSPRPASPQPQWQGLPATEIAALCGPAGPRLCQEHSIETVPSSHLQRWWLTRRIRFACFVALDWLRFFESPWQDRQIWFNKAVAPIRAGVERIFAPPSASARSEWRRRDRFCRG